MENFSLQKLLQNWNDYIVKFDDKDLEKGITKRKFLKNVCGDKSIFSMIDVNGDNKISEREFMLFSYADTNKDDVVTEKEFEEKMKFLAKEEAIFSVKRNIDKWFTLDINRDGEWSNVETKLGDKRMFGQTAQTDTSLDATLDNEELAKLYNIEEKLDVDRQTLENWMENWANNTIEEMKLMYGVKFNEDMKNILIEEMKMQLNIWLFKTGDNKTKDAPLYNSANCTAYTRLITSDAVISCCGGDISKPPIGPQNPKEGCAQIFRSMDYYDAKNHSSEVKNRLAWAMFNCKSQKEVKNMSKEEYKEYQAEWQAVRNMTAQDFRELLKPENKAKKEEFETKSIMSVNQIVQYIDIVESEIGVGNWDNENWEINTKQFYNIIIKVNGTDKDEELLNGKTRTDVPENRQALLRFLEEKGWLCEQFK